MGKKQFFMASISYADKGQKVAFVGATGAGKTAITNLINLWHPVRAGAMMESILNWLRKDSASFLESFFQDTRTFTEYDCGKHRSWDDADATREEILEAARIANVDSFVMHLDQGIETVLTDDGAGLS